MKKLSIIGKDYQTEEHVTGYVQTGDRAKYWGSFGALWGSVWGLLLGSAALIVPGFGHLIVLGPLTSALLNVAGGAALGAGAGMLGGVLSSIGLHEKDVLRYQTAITAGQFALVIHGTEDEAAAAKAILERGSPVSVETHAPADAATQAR